MSIDRPDFFIQELASPTGVKRFKTVPTDATAKRSVVQRDSSLSSLGQLDELSLELLHMILNMLDFQTLLHFSCVSLRGLHVLQSLPAYRDVIDYAPTVLPVLARTRLMYLHSAALIRHTLCSPNCVYCESFGPFLFLPTCERCCWSCLSLNQSLRVITVEMAAKYLALRPGWLKQIPIIRSVPEKYSVKDKSSRSHPLSLVAVKAAKELAMKTRGSRANPYADRAPGRTGLRSWNEWNAQKWLWDAPLNPQPSPIPGFVGLDQSLPTNRFRGMASMPFPSILPDRQVEVGVWCKGCREMRRRYFWRHYLERPRSVANRDSERILEGMQLRARSKAEHLEHIKHCPGM